MTEDEKEAMDDSDFCLCHCVDGGAITGIGGYSFVIAVFVVSEGHSNGDVQLAVGYSGLGLRREVVDGHSGFGVDLWKKSFGVGVDLELTFGKRFWMKILFLVILLIVLAYSVLLHALILPCNCGELHLQLLDPLKFLLAFLLYFLCLENSSFSSTDSFLEELIS